MLKAIFAKHVQAGDIILLSGGNRVSVGRIEQRAAIVLVYVVGDAEIKGDYLSLDEYDIVGLGHRPRPDGTTEQDELERVKLYAKTLQGISEVVPEAMESHIKLILETIEAYELGKPLEPEKK